MGFLDRHDPSRPLVHIVLADRGWILEKLAGEITSRLPGVSASTDPDPAAAIQYYMNYSARRGRISPVEAAFFTHSEAEPEARQRFFDIGSDVDVCIAMSNRYACELREAGAQQVLVFDPGVDFDRFHPKLNIGVVGRTYHTGRKGERLIEQLLDLDFVDWHFTGDGWPLPGRHVPGDRLGEFYRQMDYILVPALYEGGPMCVLEALACGTPVIAPPIGWVGDFPHIEYPVGDAETLRKLLGDLIEPKRKLARSVAHRSWDRWADQHRELFDRLLAGMSPAQGPQSTVSYSSFSTNQLLHGSERTSRGGPSSRVPRTATLLQERNIPSRSLYVSKSALPHADIGHLYNVWPPATLPTAARAARATCDKMVFSPIFLDLSALAWWQDELLDLLRQEPDPTYLGPWFRLLGERVNAIRGDDRRSIVAPEPVPGYRSALKTTMELADGIVCLSECERRALSLIHDSDIRARVIHNPVDALRWSSADPALFSQQYQMEEYLLCIGRVEPRKNQLAVALALRDSEIPVVFLGGGSKTPYTRAFRALMSPSMVWIDHLDHDDPLFASALKGARAAISASWAEGASLASLEAAAAGASLITTETGSEHEYFGAHARYVDPWDLESIRSAVLDAMVSESDAALAEHVAHHYSWDRHVSELATFYKELLGG